MLKHPELTDRRIELFINEVLRKGFFRPVKGLEAAVHQTTDPISYADAVKGGYRPVKPGFRWGPRWSTAWFRLRGRVPAAAKGRRVWVHVNCGSEACLWVDGTPRRGLNPEQHRAEVVLDRARGGERIELFVEAACNAMFGVDGYGGPEHEAKPARFEVAELGVVDEEVWGLYHDMRVLWDLMRSLPEAEPRRKRILYALNEAVNRAVPEDLAETASHAREALEDVLDRPATPSAHRVSVIGHAHIDTAWLWPLRETVRKCARTFSTTLRLMERYPAYRYQQGQPQLYAFVKEHYPELYAEIRERVREGRWEAAGAMWVEADCNISSGESLVRQIVHGQRFFEEEFGASGRYLWLPDVFGYSAAMPQILRQCGLDSFITQKISWSQFNRFPHHTFWWEGIDGTRLFTHFLPANNYNGYMTPSELRGGSDRFAESDRCERWLYVFGWGDGGGGPEEEMLESFARCANLEGTPKLEMEPIGRFLERAHAEARDLPVWAGELYLELHRGTYTTQARNKRANRKSELLLRDAEVLAALSPRAVPRRKTAETLDRAWKLVLLNQFHDIIPGSSITWVYEDSQRQYAEVRAMGEEVCAAAEGAWASRVDTRGRKAPVVVWNTLSWDRGGLLELPAAEAGDAAGVAAADGTVLPVQRVTDRDAGDRVLAPVDAIGSLGHGVVDLVDEAPRGRPAGAARAGRGFLENDLLRVEVDDRGRVSRIYDKEHDREVVAADRPANDLVLYEDRPTAWDAWDVEVFYLEKPLPDDRPAKVRTAERGPWRAVLSVDRPIGANSTLTQRIELRAGSRRIDFRTVIDWQERRRLLRALFPVQVYSHRATYEIQYGNLERPTHFNTSWDWARFEVPAQKWVDLHEPGYGVALLNDCKYGHSVHRDVLGLSLLRGSTAPDPEADYGRHEVTYSLLPHAGDYREGDVVREGYDLNVPLRWARRPPRRGPTPAAWSALSVEDPNVVVEAVKPREDGEPDRVIVRFYEAWGRRGSATLRAGFDLAGARAVDLRERPTRAFRVRRSGNEIEVPYGPFSIRTIELRQKTG